MNENRSKRLIPPTMRPPNRYLGLGKLNLGYAALVHKMMDNKANNCNFMSVLNDIINPINF